MTTVNKKKVWYWGVNILSVVLNVLFEVLLVFLCIKYKLFEGNKNHMLFIIFKYFIYFFVAFLGVAITKKLSTNKHGIHISLAVLISLILIYFFISPNFYFLLPYGLGLIGGVFFIKK